MTQSRSQTLLVIAPNATSLCRFRAELIGEFLRSGWQIIVCMPEGHPDKQRRVRSLGVAVRVVEYSRASISPIADIKAMIRITSLIREVRPDLIFTYGTKSIILGGTAARLANAPRLVAMIAGLGYAFGEAGGLGRRALSRVLRLCYAEALRTAECVVFQNDDDLEIFRSSNLLGHRTKTVRVHGSGVDLRFYSQAPLSRTAAPIFLLASRLLKEKGVAHFVSAARIVRAKYPDVRFQLLGPLDPNPASITDTELRSWIAEGIIEYLGHTDDVRPHIAAATVVTLPTYYREGVPRVLLEALAMGRAVITTDTPGCRDTVEEEVNGLLVQPRNFQALAVAMERFAQDHPGLAVRMGNRSRSLAERRFDVQEVNRTLLQAFSIENRTPIA